MAQERTTQGSQPVVPPRDRIASDRIASDRIASDRIASDRIASDRIASDRIASDRIASDTVADLVTLDARVRYRIVAGLLFPATLGAAIVWWVQAATWRPVHDEVGPILWALWFGAWFLIYHGVWYIHLVTEHEGPSQAVAYPMRRFAADLVDVSAIICAFAALGFASGQYHLVLSGVYAAAGLIPLAALIGRSHRRLGNTALMAIAGLASLVGVGTHLADGADGITSLDVTLLREFWLVLVAYLVVPSVFGTKVGRISSGFTGEIYGVE